jgi:hypothetical protein
MRDFTLLENDLLTNIDHMGSQWNLTGILVRPLGEPIQSRHATAIADVVPSV